MTDKPDINQFFEHLEVPRNRLQNNESFPNGNIFVERFDKTHPVLQGNKWYKLKQNLFECVNRGHDTLLTFGGAFSNHIHATAGAGSIFGLKTIGVIRGERTEPLNPTLSEAESFGMKLHFVSRSEYRERYSSNYIEQLSELFGNFYFVPEGGSNRLGYLGAAEMLPQDSIAFDYIVMATGSGGTLGGNLIGAAKKGNKSTRFLSIPVLKDHDYVIENLKNFVLAEGVENCDNLTVIDGFHFGGYAKTTEELIQFIIQFQNELGIELDPVYTGKVFYAVSQLSKKKFFRKDDRILVYHTGGLQGKAGFIERFPKYDALIVNFEK